MLANCVTLFPLFNCSQSQLTLISLDSVTLEWNYLLQFLNHLGVKTDLGHQNRILCFAIRNPSSDACHTSFRNDYNNTASCVSHLLKVLLPCCKPSRIYRERGDKNLPL